MTFDPIQFLLGFVGIALFILLFLRFWQFLISLGIKDSKYPIVQHADRRVVEEKKPLSPFLSGSKVGKNIDEESTRYVEEIMKKGLQNSPRKKSKFKRHPFVKDLMDLRRAILLDDLMDRKWKDPSLYPDEEDSQRRGKWDDK